MTVPPALAAPEAAADAAPREPGPRRAARPTSGRRGRRFPGGRPLWLMLPTLLLLVLVIVVPFLLAVWIGFLDLDQYTLRQLFSAPFIGLKNYSEGFAAGQLLHSIWISAAFSVLTTAFCLPVGLLAALAVNSAFRGRGLVRSAFLIPYVIPSFVTAMVWRFLMRPDGAFNDFLAVFGITGGQWLIGEQAFWALVIVDTWAAWPFIYMMTTAGMQAIPDELYEAAALDGAGWVARIRHVVLPGIRHQLLLGLLLSTLAHFNNFTLPYVLLGSPAPDAALTLPVNIFQTSFQFFRFGLGSAMSVISLVLLMIPAIYYLRASKLTAAPGED
ncbi:carbohydrate ABC transporter membrane protein 1, CUT1 family [Quadrisphaera granulorum]|uniref:Carbohydrate ABC transporter membrane protein 1 (CUT1 family) n=1 Tax=Quadrisphaera granulorum TaxID=317664 RepID=A0A316A9U9_9ACTN|nr:sugar ABC transporter permease [Quadrisphaera granulorum]PWJ54423.1 carbohydrate ABC transporter membrane protein 1 (CUT1 family) [Quadrisphaera granulorum]SZE96195.1 carbohydrate ABC transporter membrane protein 1, CUT1 family [Quadrisphaera granulorum]